jgi:D-3-phosphoglycerate dehydrogenase
MAERPVVLLTNPIHEAGVEILAPHAELVTAADTAPETLRRAAAEVDGIIVRAQLPGDIADHAPRLKGMVRHGVGLDFIPVEAATKRGVAVANLPGCNTGAVAEYFFSALLHLRRPLYRLDSSLRSEGWNAGRSRADGTVEISGTTLGIVGLGAIGSRIAQIASGGYGMRVLAKSRSRGHGIAGVEEVELPELFAESDAVAVCCALTEETRGLVSAELISQMKPAAVVVNMARGPIVDSQALGDALKRGRLAGAALDVFDSHPLPEDDPLRNVPNLLLTPHSAAITATSLRIMSTGAAREMLRILRGERPVNFVNPESWPATRAGDS